MKNLGKIISIFIGTLYVVFVIWNRLIRERLPRDIFIDYNNYILFAYFLLFFSSLYIVIYSLREILQIHAKYRLLNKLIEKPIFEKIFRIGADIVINYILKGPKNLYEFLYKNIKIRPFIDKVCEFIAISKFTDNISSLYFLLIVKNSINIFLLFIFMVEVFIFHQFHYFYKSLSFLLIPLIIEIFLFMIYHLAKRNKIIIEEWINFPINDRGDGFNMRLNIENKNNPLLEITDENLLLEIMKEHAKIWHYYLYSCMIIDNFYNLEKKVKSYLYIFIYLLYSIGWGYILFGIFFFK